MAGPGVNEFLYPAHAGEMLAAVNARGAETVEQVAATIARMLDDRDRALEDYLSNAIGSVVIPSGFPITYDNGRSVYSIYVQDAFVGSEDLLVFEVRDKATGKTAQLILNNNFGFPGHTLANLVVVGASLDISSPLADGSGFDGAHMLGVTWGLDLKIMNSVTGAVSVDLHKCNGVTMTLIGNTTLSFVTAGYNLRISEYVWTFYIKQDGTGGRTLTWPTATPIRWAGGVAPVITPGANKLDIITLRTHDEFTEYFGTVEGTNYS